MRLYTFVLALCVCALHARAASISLEKKLDDLDNVDLDNVAIEPELIDQVTVKDIDNSLRKTIVDIPVKVVEEPAEIDENSNDYVPKIEESIIIKRIDIDLANPGPPQRQEHETQNPENYGEKEKALFGIKKTIEDSEKVFNEGFQEVTNSFKSLFGTDENLPAIQHNLQNLRQSFTEQIVKLNETIRANLKPDSSETDKESVKNLEFVESRLENLRNNFEQGVDTLTEGVEILTIIKEEDEAAKIKTKSVVSEEIVGGKADTTPDSKPVVNPEPATSQKPITQAPVQVSTNPIMQFLEGFRDRVTNTFSNLNLAIQNNLNSIQQSFGQPGSSNQGQNTAGQSSQAQQAQNSKPPNAQSDTAASVPAPTPAPWGPQAFIQQFLGFINPPQNIQQDTQPTQQTTQPPANNRPIAQALQGIVQFIQRPGQAFLPQQPINPTPAPVKAPENPTVTSKNPENVVPAQADTIPAEATPQQVQPAPQTAPVQQPQLLQNRPLQQIVQNNPIIKGIQNVVQRIQGTPSVETPRNEEIKDEKEGVAELKGRPGLNANQGDIDFSGVEKKVEGPKEENIAPKGDKDVVEEQIKAEETRIPSLPDKTE